MNTADFRKEPKVIKWEESLRGSGCAVKKVTPLSLLYKSTGELLFALFDADASDPGNRALPRYIFIRGNACIVVPLVKNSATGEERYCMIRQRRIGNGAVNLEFPAGMLDRDVDAARNVAVKELREETGLIVSPDDLRELHKGILYSSPGASDEGIYYFGCIVSLPDDEFKALDGRVTGNETDGETITVSLCTRETAENETVSLQARLGMYLFGDHLKKIRRVS
jgi:8-oxo-dGTP pyrophosphatase MutT (NUDIX family)